MEETKRELYQAILNVWEKVKYVQKSTTISVNSYASYKAATEADFIDKLRPAMIEEKLIILPIMSQIVHHSEVSLGKEDAKKTTISCVVTNSYKLIHVPTGQFEILVGSGEGADNGDKATPKAMTNALKYVMRQAYYLETGNDPDTERPENDNQPTISKDWKREAILIADAFGFNEREVDEYMAAKGNTGKYKIMVDNRNKFVEGLKAYYPNKVDSPF